MVSHLRHHTVMQQNVWWPIKRRTGLLQFATLATPFVPKNLHRFEKLVNFSQQYQWDVLCLTR